jgi:hypothetical protein
LTHTLGRDSTAREFWFFDLTDQMKTPRLSQTRLSFKPEAAGRDYKSAVRAAGIDNENDQVP